MSLSASDVKLFESERLTDTEDGGGRATGNEVQPGQVNNLFEDISRLDRATGNTSLRKVFLGLSTNDAAPYLGSHVVLTKSPQDPNVSVTLFDTDSEVDERRDARDFLESYLVPAGTATWQLLGNQLQGSRSLVAFQPLVISDTPRVGETFVLQDPQTGNEQYVRLNEVTVTESVFIYQNGNAYETFKGWRLEMGLDTPLQFDFPSGEARPGGVVVTSNTLLTGGGSRQISQVFTTDVADVAQYYGVARLTQAPSVGDRELSVDTVFSQLVPVATNEIPLVDRQAGGSNTTVVRAGQGTVTENATGLDTQSTLYTRRPIRPGSLVLSIAGSTYRDDSAGGLTLVSGAGGQQDSIVDYLSGRITLANALSGSATWTYEPGAAVQMACDTGAVMIDDTNRGLNYTLNLAALPPRPGTFVLAYRALGRWNELRDRGDGVLTGIGTGTINFQTGSVLITLSRQPDVDTPLVYRYASQAGGEFKVRAGTAQFAGPDPELTLSLGAAVAPETLTLTNQSGTVNLTDDGAGALTGTGGTGSVVYATGQIRIRPAAGVTVGTLTAAADTGEGITAQVAPQITGGAGTFTIPGAPLEPGTVDLTWYVARRWHSDWLDGERERLIKRTLRDDGNGGFIGAPGTIDYANGDVSIPDLEATYEIDLRYLAIGGEYSRTETRREELRGDVTVAALNDLSGFQSTTEQLEVEDAQVVLANVGAGEMVFPGSVLLEAGGQVYIDRDGTLFTQIDPTTGAGVAVGSINYANAECVFDDPPGGTVQVRACLVGDRPQGTEQVQFRTEIAPIRAGSLQLSLNNLTNGQLVTAEADANGSITGEDGSGNTVTGTVDSQSGFVTLDAEFGALLGDIRYNAVGLRTLPLDPEIVGLDPVRLPQDGQVPIFRPGNVVVLNHTAETALSTPAAGETVTLDRDHQADIIVYGAAGDTELDPEQYTVDLDGGALTFADPLTLQDAEANLISGPWLVRDRIEHMSLVTDVQLSGLVELQAPTPHDFPATETVVSSAVLYGNLQARAVNLFTQRTWQSNNPNWGSEPDQSGQTDAEYNDIAYPVQAANYGTVTEKWALVFTGTSTFNIVGESLGVIGQGSTSGDTAPINPMTNTPYFILDGDGWGSGWATGNAVRFDTQGALAPLWIARTVKPGQGTVENDSFELQLRGDAD
ncbi:MAG: hypothetical protein CMI02_14910 [Oceanospirillaceae bacterium]|nr:hypothetical protein [Oceanospirillaceae bacterium]